MVMKPTKVSLVDGTYAILINLDAVCFPKQTFVRLGLQLIAGIVDIADGAARKGIYIWRQKTTGGAYEYVGNLIFRERDESIALDIYEFAEPEPPMPDHTVILAKGANPNPLMVNIGFAFVPDLLNKLRH